MAMLVYGSQIDLSLHVDILLHILWLYWHCLAYKVNAISHLMPKVVTLCIKKDNHQHQNVCHKCYIYDISNIINVTSCLM